MVRKNGPILIALPYRELLRVLRKRIHQVIPIIQMICVRMVRIEPGEIGQLSSLTQCSVVRRGRAVDRANVSTQIGIDKARFQAKILESCNFRRRNCYGKLVSNGVGVIAREPSDKLAGFKSG